MKQGEPPPKGVKELVLKLAGATVRPTNREIREAVQRRFEIELSYRSISRYCEAAGLPTSSRENKARPGVLTPQYTAQAERSGHWPGLRKIANTLQEQLSAPLQQLLGISHWDISNPALSLERKEQELKVTLQVEQNVLFAALKQHLPGDRAWSLLNEWKTGLKDISGRLAFLCTWVREQPELKVKRWFTKEETIQEALGVAERFAQLIVLNSTEDAYLNRCVDSAFYRGCMEQEYELHPLQGANRHVLIWQRGSASYVIVVSKDLGELENLKNLHMALRDRIRDIPGLKSVVEAYHHIREVENALNGELDRIANLAIFPGACNLCSS